MALNCSVIQHPERWSATVALGLLALKQPTRDADAEAAGVRAAAWSPASPGTPIDRFGFCTL